MLNLIPIVTRLLKYLNYGVYKLYNKREFNPIISTYFLVSSILSAIVMVIIGYIDLLCNTSILFSGTFIVFPFFVMMINYFAVYHKEKYLIIFEKYNQLNLGKKAANNSIVFIIISVLLVFFSLGLIRWIKFGSI